ncbi:MAG: peptide chain release factor N(5)-glutamine methyltransferase [Bacteroidota bacterium]|nr:peptide chain release factor N(5)-glutamine methyltransferase [Bacteroidota bacterium]
MTGGAATAHTVQSLLRSAVEFLSRRGVGESRRSAEILLAAALGVRRIDLYLRFDQPLTEEEIERYRAMIRRRLAGEPVQYIVGETEFFGLRFRVTPSVLIPRPETEHLAEAALDAIKARPDARVLDIGTGSGALAVVIAVHAPRTRVTAIDIDEEVLAVARSNARLHGVDPRIDFRVCDILAGSCPLQGERFDLIVSNPPYIPLAETGELQVEIRSYEPPASYTDGADGLTFYPVIARFARSTLTAGGRLLVEIGAGQGEEVRRIFHSTGMLPDFSAKDLAGIERVIGAIPAEEGARAAA